MKSEVSLEYILEMFVMGRLNRKLRLEIEARLLHDRELQEKLDEIKRTNSDFFKKYPTGEVIPEIMNRYNKIRPDETPDHIGKKAVLYRRLLIVSPAFAFVIILLFFILPRGKSDSQYPFIDSQPDITRIKGMQEADMSRPQLLIHRKKEDHVELLTNGVTGYTGDLLQLGYVSGSDRYGVILSIDGRQNVTLHFPDTGKDTALNREGRYYFPNAIELDDAPAFERFFFVTSDREINVDEVMTGSKDLAEETERAMKEDIVLPGYIRQFSILILKGEKSE